MANSDEFLGAGERSALTEQAKETFAEMNRAYDDLVAAIASVDRQLNAEARRSGKLERESLSRSAVERVVSPSLDGRRGNKRRCRHPIVVWSAAAV